MKTIKRIICAIRGHRPTYSRAIFSENVRITLAVCPRCGNEKFETAAVQIQFLDEKEFDFESQVRAMSLTHKW
jgi:hypothetical protein